MNVKTNKITIKDVAKEAGVSTALVSIVLNAKRLPDGKLDCPVRESTANKILEVVRRLEYKPNRAASSLRKGDQKLLGVITPSMASPYFSQINVHLLELASKNGYSLLFGSSEDDPEKFGELVSNLISDGVEGLFVTPCVDCAHHVSKAMDLGIPVVLGTRDIEGLEGVGRVFLDNEKGIRMALNHLYERGYRNIEMISSPQGLSNLNYREKSYMKVMSELGLDVYAKVHQVDDGNIEQSMIDLVEDAVRKGVEAVIHPGGSLIKYSFMSMRKLGYRIPEDLAMVSFDSGELYSLLTPSITQIQQSCLKTAEEAFGMLCGMIEGRRSAETILLDPIFVEGNSTACVHPERMKSAGKNLLDNLSKKNSVLVTAPSFSSRGGWTLDQQFIDVMGSSYLLAHGLGKPVENASTLIQIPVAAEYKVFVRTRNWVAPWTSAPSPGIFGVSIDSYQLPETLGEGDCNWHWQNAGSMRLEAGTHKLSVIDYNGFDARFAEILITSSDYVPSNDVNTVRTLRSKLLSLPGKVRDRGSFDFVVVGGGVAGMCAAIAAARCGLSVALIQDRLILGGNNSSEVRVGLGGRLNIGKYPSLGYLLNEFGPARKGNARPSDVYEDDKKMKAVLAEKNIKLFKGFRVTGVRKEGDGICSVIATNVEKYTEILVSGKLFADCTGDACLGVLAGAHWHMGRENRSIFHEPSAPAVSDGVTLGASMQWYCEDGDTPSSFPDIDWGLPIDAKSVQKVRRGQWYWEVGMCDDQIADAEKIRDYGMYVAYSNWSYLKNRASFKDEYANARLVWLCSVIGKRESRRLMGEKVLTENDLLNFTVYPDGCVSTSWYIDNHEPDSENVKLFKEPWLSHGCLRPLDFYPIPFRCFYSRNVPNLFMAGRDISVSHLALGTTRVMRTCAMMGETIGMAASLCCRRDIMPRSVWPEHWEEFDAMLHKGVGKTDVPYMQVYTLVDTTGARSEDC